MPRGQIVALPTVVIPPENSPEKLKSASLVAKPVWKYVGPGETLRLEWQIGLWNSTFNGITARKYFNATQSANSDPSKLFTCDLPAISLSPLGSGFYDCEIWFKDGFEDLRVIVENCVKIVEVTPPPVVYTCPICGETFNSQAELDAHIAAHPPPKYYWYRVTFIDGSVSDIPVPYDPEGHTTLWDIVDRNLVESWVYLGYY